MNLAEKIKEIRTEQNMTQKEFADRLCVSHHAVSKWETGDNTPTLPTLQLICDTFDVPIAELLDIPLQLNDDPYYMAILSTLHEFQLICRMDELEEKILEQMSMTMLITKWICQR